MERDTRIIIVHPVPLFMVWPSQAERVKENVRHDMPTVFLWYQTTDDISYFGAPVRVPDSRCHRPIIVYQNVS
jgi:hypothetical protein